MEFYIVPYAKATVAFSNNLTARYEYGTSAQGKTTWKMYLFNSAGIALTFRLLDVLQRKEVSE